MYGAVRAAAPRPRGPDDDPGGTLRWQLPSVFDACVAAAFRDARHVRTHTDVGQRTVDEDATRFRDATTIGARGGARGGVRRGVRDRPGTGESWELRDDGCEHEADDE